MAEVRLIVADDHPLLRQGLCQVIAADPHFAVIAEASDGEAALAQIEQLRPDVAVLDIDMPKLDGFAVTAEVRKRNLPVHIVFLTMHGAPDLFQSAMDLGVRGYILKDSAVLEIVIGLLAVAAGQYYVSAPLTVHLLKRARQTGAAEPAAPAEPGIASLSASERHILRLIAANKSTKEIAAELFLHYRTVENRRTFICQKLGLHGNNALLRFALQHKSKL